MHTPDEQDDLWNEGDEAPELIKKELLNTIVEGGQEPTRIDKYVMVRIEHMTRSKVQNGIEQGLVLVNDKPTKNNYKVRPGDHIQAFFYKEESSENIIPQAMDLDVVYEDDQVLVINKKPNMVVHPGVGNKSGTLINGVAHYLMQQNVDVTEIPRIGLVHRIDKDTSGLILFGKSAMAMAHLAKQFKDHTTQRTYRALVWGDVQEDKGTITAHIGRHDRNRKQFDVFPDGDFGKHSVTHYKVIERFGYVTLVECKLETGRTHQIRVHMKHLGHTLFNDFRYGGDRILKGTVFSKYKTFVENCFALCPRQALHAKTLGFEHPTTGKQMHFDSELPQDIESVLAKWRTYVQFNKNNTP
jgi:23S rRNA pseudouridine1911/1915/1917 synthase